MKFQQATLVFSKLPNLLMYYGIPTSEVISAQYDATNEPVHVRVHLLQLDSLRKIGIPHKKMVQGENEYSWTSYHLIKHGVLFVANGPVIVPEHVDAHAMPF